jgi:hypothetical protein
VIRLRSCCCEAPKADGDLVWYEDAQAIVELLRRSHRLLLKLGANDTLLEEIEEALR